MKNFRYNGQEISNIQSYIYLGTEINSCLGLDIDNMAKFRLNSVKS